MIAALPGHFYHIVCVTNLDLTGKVLFSAHNADVCCLVINNTI